MTPKDVLEMAKENGAKVVDIRFMDFPGIWQHFTVPMSELNADSFEDGYGFDGSSIRGWQPIHASGRSMQAALYWLIALSNSPFFS
jgi:glutamine synthetase